MTTTHSAENASERTPRPLTCDEVGAPALYDALLRLLRTSGPVVEDVERNTANLHRHVDALRTAREHAHDLLYPKPLPESPANAEVLFAHAVRERDLFWWEDRWRKVDKRTIHPTLGVKLYLADGLMYGFPHDYPLAVQRASKNLPTVDAVEVQGVSDLTVWLTLASIAASCVALTLLIRLARRNHAQRWGYERVHGNVRLRKRMYGVVGRNQKEAESIARAEHMRGWVWIRVTGRVPERGEHPNAAHDEQMGWAMTLRGVRKALAAESRPGAR